MYPIQSDVAYTEQRNRLTVLVRLVLLIPHGIVLYLWQIANNLSVVAQWFVILFTGKRNESIFNFNASFSAYSQNVGSYALLLHDHFPAFGESDLASPARYKAAFERKANRITCFFRIITVIPAAIIMMFYGLAMEIITFISWFVIVITGRQPRGMWEFNLKAMRLAVAVQGYYYLLTDVYPWPKVAAAEPNFAGRPVETAPWKS